MRATTVGVALVLAAAVGACSRPKTFDALTVRPPVARPTTTTTTTTTTSPPQLAAYREAWNEQVFLDAMVANAAAAERESISTSSVDSNRTDVVAPTDGRAPCDGDLPPCWRIIGIESGGRWDAYNPTGCDGNGCFGPYQFSGAWAGKLGLPSDLWSTTHEQWVAAARELWNHGAGCANWQAC